MSVTEAFIFSACVQAAVVRRHRSDRQRVVPVVECVQLVSVYQLSVDAQFGILSILRGAEPPVHLPAITRMAIYGHRLSDNRCLIWMAEHICIQQNN